MRPEHQITYLILIIQMICMALHELRNSEHTESIQSLGSGPGLNEPVQLFAILGHHVKSSSVIASMRGCQRRAFPPCLTSNFLHE